MDLLVAIASAGVGVLIAQNLPVAKRLNDVIIESAKLAALGYVQEEEIAQHTDPGRQESESVSA